MSKFIIAYCFMSSFIVLGQEDGIEKLNSNYLFKNVSLASFGYSNYQNEEQHSNFTMDWRLNENNSLLLRGYYDTNSIGDHFKSQLFYKRSITKKLYLLSGLEMNIERNVIGDYNTLRTYKVVNGIGYKVQENFLIEAVNEIRLGNSSFEGNAGGNLIRLGAKYKF